MDKSRRWILIGLVSVFTVSLAVATVFAATSITDKSPLFNYRMQQASSRMNFMPARPDTFTYTTEQGSCLNYGTCMGCSGALPLHTHYYDTCIQDCTIPVTCETCPSTCWSSCGGTCETCYSTSCGTCYSTCSTCSTCAPAATCGAKPTCFATICVEC